MNRTCLVVVMFLIAVVAPLQSQLLPLLIPRDSAMTLLSGRYRDSVHLQHFFGDGEARDTLDGLLDAVQCGPYTLLGRAGRAELQFDSLERLVVFTWQTGPGLLRQDTGSLPPDSATASFVHATHFQRLLTLLSDRYGVANSGADIDTTFTRLQWPTDTMKITLTFDNPTLLSATISYPKPLPRKSEYRWIRVRTLEEPDRPPIIDNDADGHQQLQRGIDSAANNGKRPLLLLGAEWCARCDSLYDLMMNDSSIAQMLKQDFQLVLVNLSGPDCQELNQQLGDPWQLGLPVLMVVDANGTPHTMRALWELQTGGSYNPTMVRALLQEWRK